MTQQIVETRTRRASATGHRRHSKETTDLFFNRELSWLDFNARVLDEAQNLANPLLERLKFLAIFSNNLDEFFMIHVPGLRERADEETGRSPTERDIQQRLRAIQCRLEPLIEAQSQCFRELLPQLAQHGIRLLRYAELNGHQQERLRLYFENEVFPVLTPLAVDPGHPFPYISNLSLSLAVVVFDPVSEREHFARVKVPTRPVLPRLVPVPGERWQFVLLEEVVQAHLERLFPEMEVRACYPFRVTRNTDLEIKEDAALDLMEMIEEGLAQRRFGEVERVEVQPTMPESILRTIMHELGSATDEEVYTIDGPLNMADFFPLANLDIPELHDPPFVPSIPPPFGA